MCRSAYPRTATAPGTRAPSMRLLSSSSETNAAPPNRGAWAASNPGCTHWSELRNETTHYAVRFRSRSYPGAGSSTRVSNVTLIVHARHLYTVSA
jgi:hypothetical protein